MKRYIFKSISDMQRWMKLRFLGMLSELRGPIRWVVSPAEPEAKSAKPKIKWSSRALWWRRLQIKAWQAIGYGWHLLQKHSSPSFKSAWSQNPGVCLVWSAILTLWQRSEAGSWLISGPDQTISVKQKTGWKFVSLHLSRSLQKSNRCDSQGR